MFGSLERIVLLKDGFALVFCRKKQRGREDIWPAQDPRNEERKSRHWSPTFSWLPAPLQGHQAALRTTPCTAGMRTCAFRFPWRKRHHPPVKGKGEQVVVSLRKKVRIPSLWGEGGACGRQGEATGSCPKTYEGESGEKGTQDAGLTPGRLVRLGDNSRSHTEILG